MAAYENVFHAFMLKAFQQLEQRIGGRVQALGCSSAPVQAPRGLDPARLVEPLERGVGASRNAVRARDLCLREHPVQAPAAMPSLDGVEYELGAILPADGSCHGGIIARSHARLHAEIVNSLNALDVHAKIDELAMSVIANTPEQFSAMIKTGIEQHGRLIKAAGIQPE